MYRGSSHGLELNHLPQYRTLQAKVGNAFQLFIKKKQPAPDPNAAPPDPPTDDGISNDDSSPPPAQVPPLPNQDQITTMRNTKNPYISPALWTAYDAFTTIDVVAGAATLTATQRVLIEDAGSIGRHPSTQRPVQSGRVGHR